MFNALLVLTIVAVVALLMWGLSRRPRRGRMNAPAVTKFGYLRQILGSMRKHRGEPVLVIISLTIVAAAYVGAGARLHLAVSDLTPDSAIGVIGSLLSFIMAMLLLQFAVAAWRLYRNQQISIATKQTLLDLDEFDRLESEQNLRAHYLIREQRYEAQLKGLHEAIVALKGNPR